LFGAQDVKLLDGGMPQWRAENRPLESGMVTRPPARFTPRFDRPGCGHGRIEKVLHGAAQVVDARSVERPARRRARPGVRSGRMPGSKNAPAAGVVENGRLASPEKIMRRCHGVDPDKPIITSRGSRHGGDAVTALDAIGAAAGAYDGLDRVGLAQTN
jgi:thiosulfate/3-mercaptopyruvate sulfurtransferase